MDPKIITALFAVILGTLPGCLAGADFQTSLAEVKVFPAGPLSTTKSGGAVSFTMWLSGIALGSAVVELDSSNPAIGQPVPQNLFFPQDAWKTPQQVTMVGRDDGIAGDEAYSLSFALHGDSFLVDYTQGATVPLKLIAVDDLVAIVTTADAKETEASLSVSLRTPPTDAVTVILTSTTASSINPNVLTFTPDNPTVAQAVTMTYAMYAQPLVSLKASSDDARYDGVTSQVQLAVN